MPMLKMCWVRSGKTFAATKAPLNNPDGLKVKDSVAVDRSCSGIMPDQLITTPISARAY